ncbi:hypothetical protein Fmac_000228 [Flemingia macrophylla]|uniref:Uncharacterized protein n=1 Tax=Flemingia macrophylla TaxID=520843 RepID=A0ABD1NDP1_9FABA
MKGITLLLHLLYTLVMFLGASSSSAGNGSNDDTKPKQVYIVYMGAADSSNASLRNDHAQLLNSVLRRNKKALVRNYKHGFSGFAARLSKEEAESIAKKPGVVSVFPDPILKLHTTHSWDFLKYQTRAKINTKPNADSDSSPSSDIILGILDTGIWPESPSFSDEGMGPVPSRWKGTCMTSQDFNSSNCNRKLIGARFYTDPDGDGRDGTARDSKGHGTHVASTAVGAVVENASFYGLAGGTAKGGSPGSRLAVYKVCSDSECSGSAILAGFDDAIADGVDVLSLSLGAISPGSPEDLTSDSVAIGAFHAVERGILVVCAAGNSGPTPYMVVNDAPWIFTVAASTIDRDFQQCQPGALDGDKIKGKIVVCNSKDEKEDGEADTFYKLGTVEALGGIAPGVNILAAWIGNSVEDVPKGRKPSLYQIDCPEDSSSDLISNINYPSIAINITGKGVVTVSRTVTNVGEDETVYFSVVDAPGGVNVTVTPDTLEFTESSKKMSYQVIFSTTLTSLKEHLFGSVTWSNGNYMVRSPFVVTT